MTTVSRYRRHSARGGGNHLSAVIKSDTSSFLVLTRLTLISRLTGHIKFYFSGKRVNLDEEDWLS
jgi:hypothetical protein